PRGGREAATCPARRRGPGRRWGRRGAWGSCGRERAPALQLGCASLHGAGRGCRSVGPQGRRAWARGARLAAVCAISFGAVTGVSARLVASEAVSLRALAAAAGFAFLVLWPLLALAVYASERWLGLEPLPWLYEPEGGRRPWHLLVVVAGTVAAMLAALPPPQGPVTEYAQMSALSRGMVATTGVWEEGVFRLALLFPLAAALGVRNASRRVVPLGLAVAILVTGALFAAAHLPNVTNADSAYVLFTFVQKGLLVGGILGLVAWRWGVEAAVLAHVAFDAIALLAA